VRVFKRAARLRRSFHSALGLAFWSEFSDETLHTLCVNRSLSVQLSAGKSGTSEHEKGGQDHSRS